MIILPMLLTSCYKVAEFNRLVIFLQFNNLSTSCAWQAWCNSIKYITALLTTCWQACYKPVANTSCWEVCYKPVANTSSRVGWKLDEKFAKVCPALPGWVKCVITSLYNLWIIQNVGGGARGMPSPTGCSIYCSRTFGTLFWNDIKWSAHGVLEQCLVYYIIVDYICVQPCITISLVIRIIKRIMICCYLYV
jgi:hypothetical protein